ncbi:hypothetical protein LTR08_002905 [Meristemomyces frigidus]|nr:hypothetical protein LTR08_002905 [Meristemomyces frigidus]
MAEVNLAPNFGSELLDGFRPVHAWVAAGIQWLDDMQQFYRERSAIEKDYAAKLAALANKYFERKSKKTSPLSVGDTPTHTPGSLESASLTTWTVQLTTLEARAAEHERFSAQLVSGLAAPLQSLQSRYEELRKSHAEYAAKLEKERDATYADLRKTKGKYDGVCQDVENKRKKIESSFDHGKTKAQGAYVQQQSDMRNMKNTYLIAINVTNKQKERYYHEYVPDLLDSLQTLAETRTATLNTLWSTAATLETETLTRSTQLLSHLASEIPRNNPVLDSMMFARHNTAPHWQDPPDFAFEPSPVWLDDAAMAADGPSKTFLLNILTKSKAALGELRRECDAKRKDVDAAKRVRQLIRQGRDKRDEVEVVRMQFYHQEALHEAERKMITAEVEVATITANVGDVSASAKRHAFKNETFRLPTNCDLCGDRIWGLSAKGHACGDCGFTCHTKCELKVPADCPGELTKEQRKTAKAERQAAAAASPPPPASSNGGGGGGGGRGSMAEGGLHRSDTIGSMNTLSSGYAHRTVSGTAVNTVASEPPRHRPVAAPPPPSTSYHGDGGPALADEGLLQRGTMLYAYTATTPDEVSVAEGEAFALVEADDGSGWVRIRPCSPSSSSSSSSSSPAGLVPASYIALSLPPATPATPTSPFAAARPANPASRSTTSLAPSTTSSSTGSAAKKIGPVVAPRRAARKHTHTPAHTPAPAPAAKYVRALYPYPGSGAGETQMREGERLVLVQGDGGDGWCEVEGEAGRGVVPSGWVREEV